MRHEIQLERLLQGKVGIFAVDGKAEVFAELRPVPVLETGVAKRDDERKELLEALNLGEQRLAHFARRPVHRLQVFLGGPVPNLHHPGNLLGIERRERTLDPLRHRPRHVRAHLPDVRVRFKVLHELRQVLRPGAAFTEYFLPLRVQLLALLECLVMRVDRLHAHQPLLDGVDVAQADKLVVLEPRAVAILGEGLFIRLELLFEFFRQLLHALFALGDDVGDDARPRHRLPVH